MRNRKRHEEEEKKCGRDTRKRNEEEEERVAFSLSKAWRGLQGLVDFSPFPSSFSTTPQNTRQQPSLEPWTRVSEQKVDEGPASVRSSGSPSGGLHVEEDLLLLLGLRVDVSQHGDVREVDPELAQQSGHPVRRRRALRTMLETSCNTCSIKRH